MKWERGILWFRNDLRLHDNEALLQAVEHTCDVIPVYCIDPRHFEETSFGFSKTGSYRASFLLQSLADLREGLRSDSAQGDKQNEAFLQFSKCLAAPSKDLSGCGFREAVEKWVGPSRASGSEAK